MNERVQYLLTQYENNNCSRGEMEELFAYIKNMGNNNEELKHMIKNVYDNICKDHPSFSYVNETGELVFTDPQQPDTINQFSHPVVDQNLKVIKVYRRVLLLAAILIVTSLILVGVKRFSEGQKNKLATAAIIQTTNTASGEIKKVVLPDGSQAWLNANSSISVPEYFSKNDRKVELVGQALFKIKQEPNVPFIIKTSRVTAQSDGAAQVDVKAYAGENDVTVFVGQGLASVWKDDKVMAQLTAGRLVKLGQSEKSVTERDFSMQNFGAWQWGELVYENTMFRDIVSDLQRKYGTVISFERPELGKLRMTATFKSGTEMEEIIQRLSGISQTPIDSTDNGFIIR